MLTWFGPRIRHPFWPFQIDPPQECRCVTEVPSLAERTRRAEYDLSFERGRSRRVLGVAHAGTPSRDPTRHIELSAQQYVEQERKATIRTRNCRLAAIRSFFSFVADNETLAAQHCAEVLRVPFKKAPQRALCYLESAEVSALLSQPDRTKMEGQRDHALISFLYNTGARIQEALNLRPQDVHLKSPTQVTLMGKDRKERISPIWPETAELIAALLRRHPRRSDEVVLVNRYGEPPTASGFRFRLRQYVKAASIKVPTLARKRITPHVFRHSTAVHLISAGVDVTVIRSRLGHAHLDTTNHYAQATLETKRKALEQVDSTLRPTKPPRWKRDADLLAWLDSL